MFHRFLKFIKNSATPRVRPTGIPDLSAIAHLDRNTLEDIGVSPAAVSMSSPLKVVRWNSVVIASGLSARWSLSGDWDRAG